MNDGAVMTERDPQSFTLRRATCVAAAVAIPYDEITNRPTVAELDAERVLHAHTRAVLQIVLLHRRI